MTAQEPVTMEVEQPTDADKAAAEYTPGPTAVDLTPENDGGVMKEIKVEGTGDETPPVGSSVTVHYVGTLTNGSKFDSSRDRGEKFEFTLGKGNVIKAWDLGVATMKRGEVAVLYCKAQYAYGEAGSPPKIPPGATLVFEVELFDWKLEDISKKKDGGIQRQTIRNGTGYSSPNDEALVEIHLIGRHDGRVFDERDISYNLGDGVEHNIPEGVDQALLKFKKAELSLIKLAPAYGFGSAGNEQFGVPPNANVEYEIELKNFEKAKESWSMDAEEKLEQAKISKEKGTAHFKAGKYSLANRQYAKIIEYLEFEKSLKDEKAKERDALMLAAYLNQAMCCLKLNDLNLTRDHCNKALELDPKNEKGLFRLGQALLGLHEPEQAKKHFEAILQFDANNKAAHNQVVICNAKIREQREKDKKLYANIFTKMAEHDRQVSDQWRFGWWDEQGKGVQLEVDLEEVEREKAAAIEEAKLARRKEHQEYIKRWGGKKAPPRPLGKDGKPLPLEEDDEEEDCKEKKEDESKSDEESKELRNQTEMPEPTHWESNENSESAEQPKAEEVETTPAAES